MAIYGYDAKMRKRILGWDNANESCVIGYNAHGELIDMRPEFYTKAILTSYTSPPLEGPKQGMCTDGKHIYIMRSPTTELAIWDIIKYDISTGEYTYREYSASEIPFGHGNDMAYNPYNKNLYVVPMSTDGAVIVVDSESLDYVKTVYLKDNVGNEYPVRQITFDRRSQQYYCSADETTLYRYNQLFECVGAIKLPDLPNATHQAMCTDGRYFYRIVHRPDYIVVSTVTGENAGLIQLEGIQEPECIDFNWDTGDFYITTVGWDAPYIYRTNIFK